MDGREAVAPQFKAPRLAEITLPCQACCLAQAYFSIASCEDWNEMGDLSCKRSRLCCCGRGVWGRFWCQTPAGLAVLPGGARGQREKQLALLSGV